MPLAGVDRMTLPAAMASLFSFTLQPKLIDAKGPHGFSLHFHAQLAGKDADLMVAYLQSIKQVDLPPNPFLNMKKGCVVPLHHHESEQFSYCISGALHFKIGDEELTLKAG